MAARIRYLWISVVILAFFISYSGKIILINIYIEDTNVGNLFATCNKHRSAKESDFGNVGDFPANILYLKYYVSC